MVCRTVSLHRQEHVRMMVADIQADCMLYFIMYVFIWCVPFKSVPIINMYDMKIRNDDFSVPLPGRV